MQMSRIFHPKGEGYATMAEAFLEAVKKNR